MGARFGGWLLGLFGALSLSAGCGPGAGQLEAARANGGKPGQEAAKPGVPVAVAPAARGTASSYYTTTAVLEPEGQAEIRSRTTGVVRRLLREEGDLVAAGALLLELEDDELRLRVRQAELALEKARDDHERRGSMRRAGVLSEEEYRRVENERKRVEAELAIARLELAHTRVQAPFPGRVVRRLVDLGAHVQPGTPLFELADVSPLLARLHVPANRMGAVAPGQTLTLTLESSGSELSGVIRLVSPIVDTDSGTVKVTAEIASYPEGTRPGDFARVRIVTERHEDALLVPSRAIVEERGERLVYVVLDGKAQRRVVQPGFVDGERTEIVQGLEAGESVVVKGQRGLQDGAAVEVMTAESPDRAARLGPGSRALERG